MVGYVGGVTAGACKRCHATHIFVPGKKSYCVKKSKLSALGEKKWKLKTVLLKSRIYEHSEMKSQQVDWLFIIPLWTSRGLEISHKCSVQLLLSRI